MHDVHAEVLQKALGLHKEKKFEDAAFLYNRLLNVMPFEESLLFLLADIDMRQENNGRAINLLCNLLQNNPNNHEAWGNLGSCFRNENQYERAHQAWMKGLAIKPTVEVYNNISTLYADSAGPEKALEWIEKALAMEPDNPTALWHKALSLLSMKQWDEGWKLYESRKRLEAWDSRPNVDAPPWDGRAVDHLYIHGEQGVGDEVMFASVIPKMKHLAKRVTLEVNKKVAGIAKQTWPEFTVVKEETPGRYDAKVAIASLMVMFGPQTKPYLKPHPDKVKHYRRELKRLGKGPYVALTWFGGSKKTRCEERTIQLGEMQPFLENYTCVSAQYSANEIVGREHEKHGLSRINLESAGEDMHDQAALLKAADAVVTVQQTAVHVAGGVGAKTFVILGNRPHWRYGIEGDSLPFYSGVRLFRRTGDWSEVIARTKDALDRELSRAEQATA